MLSGMSLRDLDDPELMAALRGYVAAVDRLDEVSTSGTPRDVVDEAEAKSVAGMRLKRALVKAGWTAPSRASSIR